VVGLFFVWFLSFVSHLSLSLSLIPIPIMPVFLCCVILCLALPPGSDKGI